MKGFTLKKQLTGAIVAVCSVIVFCCSALLGACTGNEQTMNPTTEPEGYKITFLGDSITQGMGADFSKIYPRLIAEKPGVASIQNLGASGTTIADCKMESMNKNTFVRRVSKINEDSDLIFVFGGTNDYGSLFGVSPLGTIEDDQTNTFYGALNVLVDELQTNFPDAELLFATPLQRDDAWYGEPETSPVNEHGVTIEDIRQAIIDVCEGENIEYIDLYNLKGMRLSDESFKSNFSDGLHPNNAGHAILAEAIWEKMQALLD